MTTDKKIPCIFLAFFDKPTIKKSLEWLIKEEVFDIHVIENFSQNTEKDIKPFLMEKLDKGEIKKYILFDQNISNNAFQVVLENEHIDLSHSKYICLTDGDVISTGDGWLQKQIDVLETCPEVFACAIYIDDKNLPIEAFPNAKIWLHKPRSITDKYIEVATGHHMVLLETKYIKPFLKFIRERNMKYLDVSFMKFANSLKKKWTTIKDIKLVHLTWDLYSDLSHPYTVMKLGKSLQNHWNHSRVSNYFIYTKNNGKIEMETFNCK